MILSAQTTPWYEIGLVYGLLLALFIGLLASSYLYVRAF